MNYQILEVHSDGITEDIIQKIKTFCQTAVNENKHDASKNMQVQSWETNNSSLLYLLLIEKRFLKEKGGLLLLMSGADVAAVSGYYRSDFEPGIYLMGVRSWVLKNYRLNLLVAKYLLPYQLEQIKNRNGHTAAVSFNESTQSFAKLIERSNKNPEAKLKFFFGENYPDLYKDMILWDKPVKIKDVKQWVLIKRLSPSDFDWNLLNWSE